MIRIALFLYDGARVLATLVLLAGVRAYQLAISPWLPRSCRYRPTCSQYAIEAIRRYGPIRGAAKSLLRIARCHPWAEGGWDPP